MTLAAIVKLGRRKWHLLLLAALVGAGGGFLLATTSQPLYSTSAEVFVVVNRASSASDIAQGALYAQGQARNLAEVTTKEIVLEPVIKRLKLDTTSRDLAGSIRADVPLNTSLILITMTDSSPTRAARIADAVADSLGQAVDKLAATPATGRPQVSIVRVESADVPLRPSKPNFRLLVVAGAFVMMMVALALLAMLEFTRSRLRDPEHAVDIVGAPLLGVVSFDRRTARHPMVLPGHVNSLRAEQYRQVRTSLRFLQSGRPHRSYLLTSSAPGEAKTTTAANLASIMAADGVSVCLVEGDMRAPSLSAVLDLEGSLGLSTVLAGEMRVEEALQPWGNHGLQVLLAGEKPPNPSELLGSVQAELLFEHLQDRFDVLVIDAPPLSPVTDSTILARFFGGAIMVVSETRANVRGVRRAVQSMRVVGTPILGTVVTMSREKVPRGGYYTNGPSTDGSERTAPGEDEGSDLEVGADRGGLGLHVRSRQERL